MLKTFDLEETPSGGYVDRTKMNVDSSDGTIAFMFGPSVGTNKTIGYAQTGLWANGTGKTDLNGKKPVLVITDMKDTAKAAAEIKAFIIDNNIEVLNIAGHREKSQPGIQQFVINALNEAINTETEPEPGKDTKRREKAY